MSIKNSALRGDLPLRTVADEAAALALCRRVAKTLEEQSAIWSKRSFFERQWMVRDFKKNAGMPIERWLEALAALEDAIDAGDWDAVHAQRLPVDTLAHYYIHLMELAKRYEKDPEKRAVQTGIMQTWVDDAKSLAQLIK
jgi:hypothetical protein